MIPVLIFLTYIALVLNLGAPSLVSSASMFTLCIEHTLVLLVSRLLIYNVLGKSYDAKILMRYYAFFLLGFIVCLLELHFVWTPRLNPNLPDWGYDPQRYYYYATEIVSGNNVTYGLNYQGVVYFYVACMYIFGIDPLIVLFLNTLLSLYAALLIIKLICDNKKNITKYAWILLIPEVLRFNNEASREILCMSGATIFLIKYIELKIKHSLVNIIILVASFLLVAIVRPPMALPLILGIGIHTMMHASFKKMMISGVVLAVLGGLVLYALNISSNLGSDFNEDTLQDSVSSGFGGKTEARADAASSGMTVWLIPHNPIEYVVFGVIRSFAYIIPPPLMLTDVFNQFSLLQTPVYPNLTVLAMFYFIPSIWRGVRRIRRLPSHVQLIGIVLVMYFFTIGISLPNLIHQRYRLVYDLFYFSFAIYCWTHKYEWKKKRIIEKSI